MSLSTTSRALQRAATATHHQHQRSPSPVVPSPTQQSAQPPASPPQRPLALKSINVRSKASQLVSLKDSMIAQTAWIVGSRSVYHVSESPSSSSPQVLKPTPPVPTTCSSSSLPSSSYSVSTSSRLVRCRLCAAWYDGSGTKTHKCFTASSASSPGI